MALLAWVGASCNEEIKHTVLSNGGLTILRADISLP
jgi:hypothetical protein